MKPVSTSPTENLLVQALNLWFILQTVEVLLDLYIIWYMSTYIDIHSLSSAVFIKLRIISYELVLCLHMIMHDLCKHTQIARFTGQHGAHLGPIGPRWASCWPHEPCYQGIHISVTVDQYRWLIMLCVKNVSSVYQMLRYIPICLCNNTLLQYSHHSISLNEAVRLICRQWQFGEWINYMSICTAWLQGLPQGEYLLLDLKPIAVQLRLYKTWHFFLQNSWKGYSITRPWVRTMECPCEFLVQLIYHTCHCHGMGNIIMVW